MQNQSEEKNSESITVPGSVDNIGLEMVLSNDTWKQLIEASQGLVAFISPDQRIRHINKAMASFLGGEPEQFLDVIWYDTIQISSEKLKDSPFLNARETKKAQSAIIDNKNSGKSLIKIIPVESSEGIFAGCLYCIEPVEKHTFSESWPIDTERAMYSLLNAMPHPAILCDSTGKIVLASRSFMELTGIADQNAFPGSNFVSYLAHDDIEKALLYFSSVSYGTLTRAIDKFMVRRKDRDSILLEVIISPVKNQGQQLANIMLSFRDVSGQIELEESANKNQVRLSRFNKTFLGLAPDATVSVNRLITLLGEMLGASSCSFSKFEGEDIATFASWQSPFMLDFTPTAVSGIFHGLFITRQDEIILLPKLQLSAYYQANPLLQEKFGIKTLLGISVKSGGNIIGFITLVFTFNFQLKNDDREFCSLIASALALEVSRVSSPAISNVNDSNYRELFDFFTDSIYIIDSEGVFMDVNAGASRMYGYSREEMIGNTPEMLSAPGKNDLEANKEAIKNAFNGIPQEMEWWGIRKNGEVFPKDISLKKGRYFGHDVVIAIGRDITVRKQAEDKLVGANMELMEINQSKDKFFSILAHDLKNPFGGLLGFIDLLYEDIDELSTELVKEYLQNIRTASYHTYSLLENLLEWSRIQTGKVQFRPSKFDLKEEIESVLSVLEANAIRKNIKLVNKVQPGILAEADRNMIHSVIQNLTTNAIKFSNSSSQVIIDGAYVTPEKTAIPAENLDIPVRKWFEISISDTGIGIPEDIMPKLFKLDGQFSMAGTANEPGTGLGLILCKEMVEKNGGRIRVESFQDNGSTFAFTLPLSE